MVAQALVLKVNQERGTYKLALFIQRTECIQNRDRFVIRDDVPQNDIICTLPEDSAFKSMIDRLLYLASSHKPIPVGR